MNPIQGQTILISCTEISWVVTCLLSDFFILLIQFWTTIFLLFFGCKSFWCFSAWRDGWGVVYNQFLFGWAWSDNLAFILQTGFCIAGTGTSFGHSPKGEHGNMRTYLSISFITVYQFEGGTESDGCEILISGKECSATAEKFLFFLKE